MKKFRTINLLLICCLLILNTSCKKDKPAIDSASLEINQFIWYGMNGYYLWTDSVSNLSSSKFSTVANLNKFLTPYSDHEELFNSLLYKVRDDWSWIVSDYTELEQEFQGVTLSMGYDFGLVRIGTANDIMGYVKYVTRGSPADIAGLKRGDIFTKVNNTTITISNYQNLLLNSNSYSLSLATISNNVISPNNITVSMTATVVSEDPIYLDTVYNINGTQIGYLVYNQFVTNYDLELNNVFKKFKDQGIQRLILDFRYNPGGSVQTAEYLASMVYSTNPDLLLLKTKYNDNLQSYLTTHFGAGYFNQYFQDSVHANESNPGAKINSLNLNSVSVITTGNTASASELVINALKAYIPVSVIGSNTVGKYVASITVYDYDDNGVYDSYAGAKVNSNHKWAMQPIVLKIANANGVSDFYNGFTPDYSISEYDYLGKFLQFGDINEPLLKAAINNIMGYPQTKLFQTSLYEHVADAKDKNRHINEMYFLPRDLKLNSEDITRILSKRPRPEKE